LDSHQIKLELTGERTLPGIPHENYWFQRHVAAYKFACTHARGKRVVDLGCGEGYGSAMLAEIATEVVGIDIASDVIEHAKNRYRRKNLEFLLMDINDLSSLERSFDLAISFQVVEHLSDVNHHFSTVRNILRKSGVALFTTPNRLTISKGSDKPINPFHIREYTPDELHEKLKEYFQEVDIKGLFHSGILRVNEIIGLVDFVKVYEMSKINPRYLAWRVLSPLVRSSFFKFMDNGLDNCLDILAICRKS